MLANYINEKAILNNNSNLPTYHLYNYYNFNTIYNSKLPTCQ